MNAPSQISSVGTSTQKMPTILDRFRSRKKQAVLGYSFLLATQICEKSIPWFLAGALDALREGRGDIVSRQALYVIGVSAVAWWVRTYSRIHLFNIGRDVEFELRNEILAKIHELGPSYLGDRNTGNVLSIATNDLTQVRLLVGFGGLNMVNSFLAFLSALTLMVLVSPELSLYALAPFPVMAFVASRFSHATFQRSSEAQKTLGELSGRVHEDVQAVRVLRGLGLEDRTAMLFERVNQKAVALSLRLAVLHGLMMPVLGGLAAIGTLLVIAKGGQMVLENRLSIGSFTAFYAYLAQLMWPTLAFGYLVAILQRGKASYARVMELLQQKPQVVDSGVASIPPSSLTKGEGKISVRDLSFTLGDHEVLHKVSFEIPPAQSVAIVGPTGSGKSVLASLVTRMYNTPKGTVFVDDVDVTDVPLAVYRDLVGFAPQDPFLFSTTIERNLRFARKDLAEQSEEPLRHAAREAAVLEEIDAMPEHFQTVVGERGVQLSGGQKQRVALARALLRNPTILVLDDPMSAVDAETETEILSAIRRAAEGRTLLLVTHRVAAARVADLILVLDRGEVVERGTHAELVALGGLYSKLERLQSKQKQRAQLEEVA